MQSGVGHRDSFKHSVIPNHLSSNVHFRVYCYHCFDKTTSFAIIEVRTKNKKKILSATSDKLKQRNTRLMINDFCRNEVFYAASFLEHCE